MNRYFNYCTYYVVGLRKFHKRIHSVLTIRRKKSVSFNAFLKSEMKGKMSYEALVSATVLPDIFEQYFDQKKKKVC